MKKYLVKIIEVAAILVSLSLNYCLFAQLTKENQYKKRITELTIKRNSTSSMALYTVYQDSINNAVQIWLEDDTSK